MWKHLQDSTFSIFMLPTLAFCTFEAENQGLLRENGLHQLVGKVQELLQKPDQGGSVLLSS
jgi:hypothetical protein